jgi:hypothetical protein
VIQEFATNTIVLSDFENETGDTVFDDTLRQAEFSGGHEFVNWQSSMAFGLIHLSRDFQIGQMR